ncbi:MULTISPECIES: VOC family protein [unclassified Pseudomonas]|uniref:VOC family protein n=1 Tax=unclassified Pseudomonas TaxID=196821 RepID=UPI0025FB9AA7|nr:MULTISPECIES: VOC family protein [unclassified Pseudomonas]
MSAALDHLVINTRFDTDAAAALFSQLGFTLTQRGYHSLGSINHLMMFAEGYLELIGLPLGTDTLRQEVLESPQGIDGLVIATQDPKATYAQLVRQGFLVQPVQYFSRPVEIDGASRDARFGTVRLAPEQFAAGRVYFCHHQTPELVWRPEWLGHANGVTAVAGLTVLSENPDQTRQQYVRLGAFDERFVLDIVDVQALAQRFGELSNQVTQRPERFAAITLRGADLAVLAQRAARLNLAHQVQSARVVVAIPAFETLLEFIP